MHPDRLSHLTYNRQTKSRIVDKHRDETGAWVIALACGHEGARCVAHFDITRATEWNCWDCSEAAVRADPRYADEFKGAPLTCPADGNALSDDGVCGFCGNTPQAYALP